jgi:glutamate-5-semialdehyde dehydrogenase
MDIKHYMNEVGQRARKASRAMAKADTAAKNKALSLIAAAIRRDADALRKANQEDLEAARANGLAEVWNRSLPYPIRSAKSPI